ncbi:MAG: TIR domain-containing protein [Sphingomonadaceae bacterium]|nr:TIR domain-containing protein [Sphingomonadaceae bacterium]
MVDVFISYAREDEAFVAKIAQAVKAEGYEVWWDDDLPPHKSYGDVITEKIGEAKAAIVVWSAHAAASEWVRAEADVARNAKKLVQTVIDGTTPPLPFNQIQHADLSGWTGEGDDRDWRKVLASLAELNGRTAPQPVEDTPSALEIPEPFAAAPVAGKSKKGLVLAAMLALVLLGMFAGWRIFGGDPNAKAAQRAGFTVAAVVESPDEVANIRRGPSLSDPIVGKAYQGEVIYTRRQGGKWWKVRKQDGTTGYMARHLFIVEGKL